MPAAQAVIEDRQQAIGVGRKVNAHDIGLLVDDVVEEAGILVREAVVILLPDVGGEQIVQRRDLPPPGQFQRYLQPLGVLAEHRIDDANEGLIAVEQPVPPGQQISFQPTLALVLAEHRVQHASGGREEFIILLLPGRPTDGW
jgi:phage tail protein X